DDEQIEAARKVIAQTRTANPLSADYLEARCMMYQTRWADAARNLEKLRPAFKSVAELALQVDLFLGLCYQKLDEPLLALAAFERAARPARPSLPARHGATTSLAAIGQRDEAMKNITALIDNNPDRAEADRWRLELARLLLAGNVGTEPQLAPRV